MATVTEGRAVATGQFDGDDLSVPDLRVGEIRALRTFRLSESGHLNPVGYPSAGPWQDGANTARCRDHDHTPAAPGCKCGFYAYGTFRAACDYDEARRVLAVVACWGRVVPGTRGLRAQYARIEAIWLSGKVRRRFVRRLRQHYPSVTFYRNRRRMLGRHPTTSLDSYHPEPRPNRLPRRSRLPGQPSLFGKLMTLLVGLVIRALCMLFLVANVLLIVALLLDSVWPGLFRHWPLFDNLGRK